MAATTFAIILSFNDPEKCSDLWK